MRRRKSLSLFAAAAAVALTMLPASAHAWFILPPRVFDAQQFAQRVADVARQAEAIEHLRQQVEGDLRMLAHIDAATLNGMNEGLDRLHRVLTRFGSGSSSEPSVALDRKYPLDWRGDAGDDDRVRTLRERWLTEQRAALASLRVVQNAVASEMASSSDRVGELVNASSASLGLTAALQTRTQLHAELSAELTKVQSLRAARAQVQAGRAAEEQSREAQARATAVWLSRPGTAAAPARGPGAFDVQPVAVKSGRSGR